MAKWKKGTIGKRPMQYKADDRGRTMVSKSLVHQDKWKWDATQRQPNMVVPDTHHCGGLAQTMREAKEAADRALSEMIERNAQKKD